MIKKLMLVVPILGMVLGALVISPTPAYAVCDINNLQNPECKNNSLLPTTDICSSARECVTWFVNAIFLVAILLSFIYLIWGGIDYIMAGGDTAAAGSARTKLTNAVIGLIVVIVAWAISNFVLKFFGVDTEIPIGPEANIERSVEG